MDARTTAFQGLRLVAIITIVAGHIGFNCVGGGEWCSFFFILSGFLYKTEIRSLTDYLKYVKHKALQLYPIYWVCLFLYFLMLFLRGHIADIYISTSFLPYLFLLQSWFPINNPMAYLGPSWFLSSLLFCYVFSFIAKWLVENTKWSIVLFIAFMVAFNIFTIEHYINPLYRFMEYSLGIWMRQYICFTKPRKEMFPGVVLLYLFFVLFLMRKGVPEWVHDLLFCSLIWLFFNASSTIIQFILGNSFILRLSKSDIFIYLTHPDIGFHLCFFFITKNAIVAILVSVLFGWVLGETYLFIKRVLFTQYQLHKRRLMND